MYAAEYDRKGCIWELLDSAEVDPNNQNPMGITALSWGSMHGSVDAVTQLLEANADPNITDCWGETALIRACGTAKPEICRILFDFGADPNIPDGNGKSALDRSVCETCSEMIKAAMAEKNNEEQV